MQVVLDYYENELGVRNTSLKWGLPSKNYIEKWQEQLKLSGDIPFDACKKIKVLGQPKREIAEKLPHKTEREKLLEKENVILRAKLDLYSELEKQFGIGLKKK